MTTTAKDQRAVSRSVRAQMLAIERDIADSDSPGLITPDQEAELDRLAQQDAAACGAMAVEFKLRAEALKALVTEAKQLLSQLGDREDSYRAKMTRTMERNSLPKVEDPEGMFTAHFNPPRGRVDLAPGCSLEHVDPTYLKETVKVEIDRGLARAAFDSGLKPGGLVFIEEPYVTITIDKVEVAKRRLHGAMAQIEGGRK